MNRLLSFVLSFFLGTWAFAADFDWQGHRGARGLFPENTIEGMKAAIGFPITTLEMDVVVSKDLKVVVSHEPWMSEEICMTSDNKLVKDKEYNLFRLTYAEIAQFDCGSKPHPRFSKQAKIKTKKPLLADLLKELKDAKVNFSIEIKSTVEDERNGFQPDYKKFTDLVLKEIKSALPIEKVMIQSFDWRVLQYLAKKYPKYKTVALIEEKFNNADVIKKLGFKPTVFSPPYELVTKEVIEYFHQQKILIIPWTVNDQKTMTDLKSLGVDGIITDYPDLIK